MNLISAFQSEKKLVDVAGIEAPPACKDSPHEE